MPSDPLQDEIARRRHDLDDVQARLLEQLRQLHQAQDDQAQLRANSPASTAASRCRARTPAWNNRPPVTAKRPGPCRYRWKNSSTGSSGSANEMAAMEELAPLGHVLPLPDAGEPAGAVGRGHVECHYGRVAYINVTALLTDVRQHLEDKAHLLRTQWKVTDTAGPIGNYRLQYAVERQRDEMDAHVPDAAPPAAGQFRYGVSEWVVEPAIAPVRGEPLTAALAKGSEFRQVTDLLDPQHAVVTFWVYPDSFAVYRQLRDYLYGAT